MKSSGGSGNSCVLDLQFLPCISYLTLLAQFSTVIIDHHERYVKQTYRNRCYILGANNVIQLVIPVKKGSQRRPLHEVEIDYSHIWLNTIWRSVASAYGNAPYFEFFGDDLHDIFFRRYELLYELNSVLLSFCLNCLDFDIKVIYPDAYIEPGSAGIIDFRGKINPKIKEITNLLAPNIRYTQIFGSKFVPNLSIIDMLFCEGPEAGKIITDSLKSRS